MRVKICGIMRAQDANSAIENGADALGFVVASPRSPRNLSSVHARKLMKLAPVFTTKVAVTTAEEPKTILNLCSRLKPDAVQLHAHSRELIRTIRKKEREIKLILASPVHDKSSLKAAVQVSTYSDAVLVDTPHPHSLGGGTGKTHDWSLSAEIRETIDPHPLILAGGLNSENVATAILKVKPFAVDVSSGVEKKIGMKDHQKIKEFIVKAKEADM
ncbi:MAG TPA: phosphoribosylanthranilate isomerase [Terriglobales bacterium]|nr:phosphoribosylanthranilate isomerase [Terriglobales bacterium]